MAVAVAEREYHTQDICTQNESLSKSLPLESKFNLSPYIESESNESTKKAYNYLKHGFWQAWLKLEYVGLKYSKVCSIYRNFVYKTATYFHRKILGEDFYSSIRNNDYLDIIFSLNDLHKPQDLREIKYCSHLQLKRENAKVILDNEKLNIFNRPEVLVEPHGSSYYAELKDGELGFLVDGVGFTTSPEDNPEEIKNIKDKIAKYKNKEIRAEEVTEEIRKLRKLKKPSRFEKIVGEVQSTPIGSLASFFKRGIGGIVSKCAAGVSYVASGIYNNLGIKRVYEGIGLKYCVDGISNTLKASESKFTKFQKFLFGLEAIIFPDFTALRFFKSRASASWNLYLDSFDGGSNIGKAAKGVGKAISLFKISMTMWEILRNSVWGQVRFEKESKELLSEINSFKIVDIKENIIDKINLLEKFYEKKIKLDASTSKLPALDFSEMKQCTNEMLKDIFLYKETLVELNDKLDEVVSDIEGFMEGRGSLKSIYQNISKKIKIRAIKLTKDAKVEKQNILTDIKELGQSVKFFQKMNFYPVNVDLEERPLLYYNFLVNALFSFCDNVNLLKDMEDKDYLEESLLSYEKMIADPNLKAVYLNSVNNFLFHCDNINKLGEPSDGEFVSDDVIKERQMEYITEKKYEIINSANNLFECLSIVLKGAVAENLMKIYVDVSNSVDSDKENINAYRYVLDNFIKGFNKKVMTESRETSSYIGLLSIVNRFANLYKNRNVLSEGSVYNERENKYFQEVINKEYSKANAKRYEYFKDTAYRGMYYGFGFISPSAAEMFDVYNHAYQSLRKNKKL